jgi:hypothetical protein
MESQDSMVVPVFAATGLLHGPHIQHYFLLTDIGTPATARSTCTRPASTERQRSLEVDQLLSCLDLPFTKSIRTQRFLHQRMSLKCRCTCQKAGGLGLNTCCGRVDRALCGHILGARPKCKECMSLRPAMRYYIMVVDRVLHLSGYNHLSYTLSAIYRQSQHKTLLSPLLKVSKTLTVGKLH